MTVSGWFRDLSPWAAVLSVLLGLLIVISAVSMVLSVVSAGIAIGAEFGSATAGAIAAIVGLVLLAAPIALLAVAIRRVSRSTSDREHWEPSELNALKEQYTSGKIDEETFERRLDELLDRAERDPNAIDPAAIEAEMRERDRSV